MGEGDGTVVASSTPGVGEARTEDGSTASGRSGDGVSGTTV
ncbi:hypothetical protein [Candidatus Chloroploca mongolica]|nr:hypothetical protein [Candidatus Chloroploca mongolica]